jgi:allantoicase
MPDLTDLVDLASERLGGAVLAASDEFFAEKENLLRAKKAVFIEDRYTDRGKWMDGWESRRSFGRVEGHVDDWAIVKLGLPGVIAAVDVDTSHFRGNFPESAAIEIADLRGADASVASLVDRSFAWKELMPRTKLQGNQSNVIAIATPDDRGRVSGPVATHLRLRIFPDGGVARLRVYGKVSPDWRHLLRNGPVIDLASVECGGEVIACNDMFFGSRHNLVFPERSTYMGDGWETRRKRVDGFDWCVVRLGARAKALRSIEVDTNWFKGNAPESCALEAIDEADATIASLADESRAWKELVPRAKLRPHTRHFFTAAELRDVGTLTHVCMKIFPDGGVSRLRIHGEVAS